MKLEHMALYVRDLEALRDFYATYFGGKPNDGYHNPGTGLRTYFLTFGGGARLELMTRPGLSHPPLGEFARGYAHMAFSTGSRQGVDTLTARLEADGYRVLSAPRQTGDGYYESVVSDPEGNRVEITE